MLIPSFETDRPPRLSPSRIELMDSGIWKGFIQIFPPFPPGRASGRHLGSAGPLILGIFPLLFSSLPAAAQDYPPEESLTAGSPHEWFHIHITRIEGRPDSADRLGSGFASLDDANGDGWTDFAVSAAGRRKMLIMYAGPGILDTIPDAILPGGGTITTGDFNGDGVQDIAVQQPSWIHDLATGEWIASEPDSVFVYFGTLRSGCIYGPEPDLRLGVRKEWSRDFGRHLGAGDFNGDGFDDLITGAPRYYDSTDVFCRNGRILIYLGDQVAPLEEMWQIHPSLPDSCHYAVGTATYVADANGDGVADIFSNAVVRPSPLDGGGRWIYTIYLGGRGIREDEIRIAQVLENSDSIGFFYRRPCDLNNDGCADLPYADRKNRGVGILLGGPEGYSFDRQRHITNPDTNIFSGFLEGAFNIGDLNGNGFDEYALTFAFNPFNGRLLVLFAGGPTGIKDTALTFAGRYLDQDWYGLHTISGDFNGDGFMDVITGAATRNLIYPETEFHRGIYHILRGEYWIQVPVGIDALDVPSSGLSLETFPNPSWAGVTVLIRQKHPARCAVDLYSATGTHIRRIHDGEAGTEFRVTIDRIALGIPPGVYYLTATSAENSGVRKMIIM